MKCKFYSMRSIAKKNCFHFRVCPTRSSIVTSVSFNKRHGKKAIITCFRTFGAGTIVADCRTPYTEYRMMLLLTCRVAVCVYTFNIDDGRTQLHSTKHLAFITQATHRAISVYCIWLFAKQQHQYTDNRSIYWNIFNNIAAVYISFSQ